jgi:hypothetical protein
MDEMQRAFNLTTAALLDTMRIADERDVKQNEKILVMEKKVEKIQQNIDTLNLKLDDLKFQVLIFFYEIKYVYEFISNLFFLILRST